ncbi:beta-glucosidase [Flagelloscypha sp. PMI_526]|nr:beta-glucosidase [Flagelloscypha sp. PMI_526]
MRVLLAAAALLGREFLSVQAQDPSSAATNAIPTPKLSAEWTTAYAKAKPQVAKLSLQDKVNLATGVGWMNGACVGNTPAVSSIGFPGLCLQDSPLGVRFADLVSAFPAAINAAATFNRDLIRARGEAIGAEFRGKGVHVALGPMMNLARVAQGGRNWEGFGADPYLVGEGAYETIMGIQSQGVQATAKHYIGNEQEHFRETSSSNIDQRTLHELYAYPFLRSVQANVASVMCSYNYLNGTYACENDYVQNTVLKGEFGFAGYLMSDWAATHSTVPSVNGGLDMTMPGDKTFGSGDSWFGSNLVTAVNNGSVPQDRMTDLATRILAAWYLVGQDSGFPATNFNSWDSSKGSHVNVQGTHKDVIRKIGSASTVLLKNVGSALPLNKPASLGIIGSGARNSSSGNPNQYSDRGGNDGVLAMGWGSGTADYPYLVAPATALITKAGQDGTTVVTSYSDTNLTAAATAATGKKAALVFITADSGEGYITVESNVGDRNDLNAWHSGNALVDAVSKVNNNTIVIINSVGSILMPWIDNANVTAVVLSGIPGQEAGNALVDVLYGAYNPSGRLPYTIAKAAADYNTKLITTGSTPVQIPYSEGLYMDYRYFDHSNVTPLFEFGFGLSYTTFNYSSIQLSGTPSGGGAYASTDAGLWATAVTVTFSVANTGTLAGTEIPQVYVTLPSSASSAPLNLRGFESVAISAGSSTTVTITLPQHAFSIWNTSSSKWTIPTGTATISVGASSRKIKLTSTVSY